MYSIKRRLNAIVTNTTMAIVLLDEQQQCVFLNQAAEKLTGYRLDEALHQRLHKLVLHHRPDGSFYPINESPITRAFFKRRRSQGEEVLVHKDGHFFPVAFTASPIVATMASQSALSPKFAT